MRPIRTAIFNRAHFHSYPFHKNFHFLQLLTKVFATSVDIFYIVEISDSC